MHNILAFSAGGEVINPPPGIQNGGIAGGGFYKIVQLGISILLITTVILALLFLIWGGVQWMTSAGDAKVIDGARRRITYAILGIALVFLSFFIMIILNHFFGITLIDLPGPMGGGCNGRCS